MVSHRSRRSWWWWSEPVVVVEVVLAGGAPVLERADVAGSRPVSPSPSCGRAVLAGAVAGGGQLAAASSAGLPATRVIVWVIP